MIITAKRVNSLSESSGSPIIPVIPVSGRGPETTTKAWGTI